MEQGGVTQHDSNGRGTRTNRPRVSRLSLHFLSALLVPVVLLATPGGAAGSATLAPGYAIRELGTLPGHQESTALAINDEGQIVGWSCCTGERQLGRRAVLWTAEGEIHDLGQGVATAINDPGDIVGSIPLSEVIIRGRESSRAFVLTSQFGRQE